MKPLHTMLLNRRSADLPQVRALYERSFPANERRNFDELMTVFGSACELLGFYEENRLLGFAFLLTWRDLCHILYFAMEETFRGRGYGTQALGEMRKWKPSCRIIADLEAEVPDASNNPERLRRMNFYCRNGYSASPVAYRWQSENYVMFVSGGTLTDDEFEAFWSYFSVYPQIRKEDE